MFQFPVSSRFLRFIQSPLVFFSVFPSLLPYICPSETYFRRQFLRQIWRIQFSFLHFIVYRIFLCSLMLCNIYIFSFSTWSVQLIGYERNMTETRPKVSRESAVAEAVRGLRYVFGCLVRLSAGAHSTDFLYDPWSPQADSLTLHQISTCELYSIPSPFLLLFYITVCCHLSAVLCLHHSPCWRLPASPGFRVQSALAL
jgi:hypothetical protein